MFHYILPHVLPHIQIAAQVPLEIPLLDRYKEPLSSHPTHPLHTDFPISVSTYKSLRRNESSASRALWFYCGGAQSTHTALDLSTNR